MPPADDASEAYARACTHDRAGEEAEAIPHYERALALGLEGEERRGAQLGLGSSLRNVGRHADAVRVLEAALEAHPGDAALLAFLGLALHSAGRSAEAVGALLDVVLRHAPLGRYARALSAYRGDLDPRA
jgi:tetratricopeptide (TPR) repeat protein